MEEENKNIINPFRDPGKYREEIINLMKQYELAIGELYRVYAQKFPENRDFWEQLAAQEQTHAYWLELLALNVNNGKVFFDEKRFNLEPIKVSIEYVNQAVSQALSGIDTLGSLVTANDIEQGLLEKRYFEIFEGDSAQFKQTMADLEAQTQEHAQKIKELLEQEKAQRS